MNMIYMQSYHKTRMLTIIHDVMLDGTDRTCNRYDISMMQFLGNVQFSGGELYAKLHVKQ